MYTIRRMFSVVLFWTALDLHYFFCLLLFLHQIERHNNSSPHNGFRNCCVTITVFAIHLWVADDSVGWPWHHRRCVIIRFFDISQKWAEQQSIFSLSRHSHSNGKSDGAWKFRVLGDPRSSMWNDIICRRYILLRYLLSKLGKVYEY